MIPNWIVLTPRHLVTMYYHLNYSARCVTNNCHYFTLSRRRTMSRPEASMVSHSIRSRVPQALLNNSTCCLRSDSFSREDTSISWVTRTSSWNLSTCWVMELVSANSNRRFCEVYYVFSSSNIIHSTMVDITAESTSFYIFMDIRYSSQFHCCEIVKRAAINVFT